jgi:molybdopterin converting factor subunit 1
VTIRVLFFAYLRERVGLREASVQIDDGASVIDLWRHLRERYQRLPSEMPRIAVNRVYVDNAHPLHENDELALIPPVSGGS